MYTILIVDDERPAQTFLKAICQKYCPAFDTIRSPAAPTMPSG